MLEELIRDFGEDGSDELPSGGERQSQHSGDPQTPFTQWQDSLETTSESTREVYVDLEAPLNYGTSSAPVTPRSSGGKHRVSDDEPTPRGPRSTSTALSFDAHYDVSAPLIDEDQRTPTEVQRRASSKIASRQLTPRPKLDLPPSDPPWSSTPSVFDEEPVPKPRYRDTSSPTPPEIPCRRYSSLPPWEVPLRTTPPSPLHFGALLSDDFDFPSSVPLPEYAYNPEREERSLQPDPFGFSRIAAIVAGELGKPLWLTGDRTYAAGLPSLVAGRRDARTCLYAPSLLLAADQSRRRPCQPRGSAQREAIVTRA